MFNFFKKWFSTAPIFNIGALESPEDYRTINAAVFQQAHDLPDDYITKMPPVEWQSGSQCVAMAIHKIKEYYLQRKGNYVDLAYEDLYALCKANDGIPYVEGTYPLIGAKLAVSTGIASSAVYFAGDKEAIAKDRENYKLGGFAIVSNNYDEICQQIFINGAVTASFLVDNNWFIGVITKVLKAIGRHYVILHGFKRSSGVLRGQNSWGINWIGKVAGFIDSSLEPGHFDVLWADIQDTVIDIYCFTDAIPKPILDYVKSLDYYFAKPLKLGDENYDVMQLQKRLFKEGFFPGNQQFTQKYGPITKKAVMAFQTKHGIFSDGASVGPQTMKALNGTQKMPLLNAQIMTESRGNDYAIGDTNLKDHAYGCLQIRQGVVDAVNAKLGTRYKSQDCLGNRDLSVLIWNTYWTIYPENQTDRDKCFAWNGGPGWRRQYMKQGYDSYTKALNSYWAKVSSLMS